ncbi:MAG: radical SAM protein [Acidimicrobiales bacterium]
MFSFESVLHIERIDGQASVADIADSILSQFPTVEPDEVLNDLWHLVDYLAERGYAALGFSPTRSAHAVHLGTADEVRVVHADIELTRLCNLRCSYCYAWAGVSDAEATADRWVETLSTLYRNGLAAVTISGGEPFMHPDYQEVMNWCAPRFVTTLNTNGGFIGTAEADWLAALDLQCVQVSLDSDIPGPHDAQRGRGSWAAARAASDLLIARSVPVRISTTVHALNRDRLPELATLTSSLGTEWNVEAMKPVGRASHLSEDRFLDQACEIAGSRRLPAVYRHLDPMEIHCQAQLGFVGISAKCHLKPCNLTEDFFDQISAPVVVGIDKQFRFSSTPTFNLIDEACRTAGEHPAADDHGRSRCVLIP